jgi:hypothetical protein
MVWPGDFLIEGLGKGRKKEKESVKGRKGEDIWFDVMIDH